MSKRAWLQFAGIAVIWGLPYFFIRIAVRDLDPGTLVCFRTGLASLILLPFVVHRRKWRELVKHWPAVLAYTLTEITVPWFLLATAEQKLSSSLAGLLVATVPIFGLLIAWALGHERPGARRVSGLILGFAGVVILAGVGVKGSSLVSMGEVVLCSIGYAIAPMIVSRRLAKAPSFEVVAASMVVTALIYLPFALTHLPRRFHAETAESVVTLSVVCTVLAFMVFFALIKEIGPTRDGRDLHQPGGRAAARRRGTRRAVHAGHRDRLPGDHRGVDPRDLVERPPDPSRGSARVTGTGPRQQSAPVTGT